MVVVESCGILILNYAINLHFWFAKIEEAEALYVFKKEGSASIQCHILLSHEVTTLLKLQMIYFQSLFTKIEKNVCQKFEHAGKVNKTNCQK